MRCLSLSVLFFCVINFGVAGASGFVDVSCRERKELVGALMDEDLLEDPSVVLEAEKKRKEAIEEARRKAEEERIAREKAKQGAKKYKASHFVDATFQNMADKKYREDEPSILDGRKSHSWSLYGRNLLGNLASPSYQGDEEGRIVVEICVDASGNVVSAAIIKGTTIIDETCWEAARLAAKNNKFSSGNGMVVGSITYNYYGCDRNLAGSAWSLRGRDLLGKLVQPSYQGNEEGRIVVEICVDAEGNVVFADIAKGTTISNETLRNAAITAAKKNKFSAGGGVAIGTITYNFRLN